jgi:hypothetical protein
VIDFVKKTIPEFNEKCVPGPNSLYGFIKLLVPDVLPPSEKTFYCYLRGDTTKGYAGAICDFGSSEYDDSDPWRSWYPEVYQNTE